LSGVVQTQLAKEQPFAQDNVNSTIQKIVYEAPINPKEQSFEVVALQAVGNNVNSVGQTVDITGCQESINFENGQQVAPSNLDESAPKIFDVKLESGNGTIISGNKFVGSQSVTVSAIVSSPTPLDKAEIRFMNSGQPGNVYNSATMTVAPLLISNTTYTVIGTIPQEMLASPATTYWVDIHNTAEKTTDSDKYTVAVKPSYPVLGNLTMDITSTRAAGTMEYATAYFTNNSTGPVYGSISLVVDGKISYTSPPQLFATGQTPVSMLWQVPSGGTIKDYQVNAIANFYGQSFTTETSPITSFQSIKTITISTPIDIEMLQENNNTVAKPAVLYSSFKNEGTMRYHVTAPDGTCVIGGASDCLVTQSTFGLRGAFKIVTIGDQTYLVRYSGPDNLLERFSITSVDPIIGQWKVGIDSQSSLLPQAQAANDVFMKIKYTSAENSVVTLDSQ
ncbi:MAG TPA: hypothetical protein VJ771_04590, partial [Candidatus Nitrosotalea sp.]|nr:hypothetical protein [Candidatus Nitrosotalea sp.]